MKYLRQLATAAFALLSFSIHAQNPESSAEKKNNLPSLGASAGILHFKGDVGTGNGIGSFSQIRPGFGFSTEYRFNNFMSASLGVLFGKLSQNERDNVLSRNFESKIFHADLGVIFHFDNGKIIKANEVFSPFIGAGVGFLTFDPHGDMKDKNNKNYYYWSDGTIRDLPETPSNVGTAEILTRDYSYETQLKDSTTNYQRNTFTLPLTAGLRFKIGDRMNANIGATYHLAFTDFIDNVKKGGNDQFLYTFASLRYQFGKSAEEIENDERYKNVDFEALDKYDGDQDGVPDNEDRCIGTPKGAKVDNKGCPLDSDKDGVPDYRDKEPSTKKGIPVDEFGVTLDWVKIAEEQKLRDSLAEERSAEFMANPSLETLKKIEEQQKTGTVTKDGETTTLSKIKIPAEFEEADINKDGYISTEEISLTIDGFFSGENDFTVDRINRLIDFFFEQ